MNVIKLGKILNIKYKISLSQAQIGSDNASKFKFAMNALFRILSYVRNPEYNKYLMPVKVNADNIISAFTLLDNTIKQWYDTGSQSYEIPSNWMGGKKILEAAMPDIEKVVIQLKTLINDESIKQKLQFYLDSLSENIRGIIASNVEEHSNIKK